LRSAVLPPIHAGPGKNSFGGYEVGYAEFDEGKDADRNPGGPRYPLRFVTLGEQDALVEGGRCA
jgi:hypothetical protein